MGLPASGAWCAGFGFDVGTSVAEHPTHLAEAGLDGRHGTWMRVRGLVDPEREQPGDIRTVAGDRAALQALRARKIKTSVHLRWSPAVWIQGVRAGGGHRLPLDLREVHQTGLRMGATYGDLVDVWEIENEPDIGFVHENPETYAAFQKAVYLGLKLGAERSELGARGSEGAWLERKRGWGAGGRGAEFGGPRPPRVIMAPLALPPGPFLARLWDNGLASYTDGFNYHYYGYAEDFTGVYRQFERAVADLGARSLEGGTHQAWPVFITEYGYGQLDAAARDTVTGRVRQWRWFADVAKQVRDLRIEGPMAFYWNPYYEAELNEFGLLMAGGEAPQGGNFSPADFGAQRVEPWMERIGKKVGSWQVSPALAYMWSYAERNGYRPRAWSVEVAPASPVVVDLVAGQDMVQAKASGGYLLRGASVEWTPKSVRTGRAKWVLYNFSAEAISGRLVIEEPSLAAGGEEGIITLAAGERREVPVSLTIPGERWARHALRARFVPSDAGVAPAVFTTALYPGRDGMVVTRVADFDFPVNVRGQEALAARPRATGEPAMHANGRWLATEGTRVEEVDGGGWRFHVDAMPAEALRPAMVELPVPEGFSFEAGTLLRLERRRGAGERQAASGERVDVDLARRKPRAGAAGDTMDVYFRTQNGNLYQTWPRLRVTSDWRSYVEDAENFTMAFFGRAELPWRFADNKPVALVFFLRPAELPAVFEVRGAEIVRLAEEGAVANEE